MCLHTCAVLCCCFGFLDLQTFNIVDYGIFRVGRVMRRVAEDTEDLGLAIDVADLERVRAYNSLAQVSICEVRSEWTTFGTPEGNGGVARRRAACALSGGSPARMLGGTIKKHNCAH